MAFDEIPQSSIILDQTEDGRTRIKCWFENETIWLTQKLIADLFQIGVNTVNYHLKKIYEEGELDAGSTVRSHRIVQTEGGRQVSREVEHYSLPAILAVGYRVRSHRGTQFRQWATARLSEFLVKGFTMDDERLKNPPGEGQKDYFDDLLERIRDIRSSERRFYQKVLDIYATSVDYTRAPVTREERAARVKPAITTRFSYRQQQFLDFVLAQYVKVGVDELASEKLSPLLKLKYNNAIADAVADLGAPAEIGRVFASFQQYLYLRETPL